MQTFINLSLIAIAAILVVLLFLLYQRKENFRQKIYNVASGAQVLTGWFGEKDNTQCNLASKPQKLSKADLEKQTLDYQVRFFNFFKIIYFKFTLSITLKMISSDF